MFLENDQGDFISFSSLKRSYIVKKESDVTFLRVVTYFLKTDCLIIAEFRSLKQNQNFQEETVLLSEGVRKRMKKQLNILRTFRRSLSHWLLLYVNLAADT